MQPIVSEFIELRENSAIHWDEDFVREMGVKRYHSVPVTCGVCGTKRPVHVSNLRQIIRGEKRTRPGQKFTGLCANCVRTVTRTGADHPNWKGGRWITDRDPYIMRHYQSFPKEFWDILQPMTRGRRLELKEHRAVMAIHLGRTLLSTELVHHRDGNKRNNTVVNLQLFRVNSGHHGHHNGHGDYYQNWQEALSEIKRLTHKS